jgi:hypothetical protein
MHWQDKSGKRAEISALKANEVTKHPLFTE